MVRKAIRQSIETDYRRLKRHLEGNEPGEAAQNGEAGDNS
jgi:hypothetical protein